MSFVLHLDNLRGATDRSVSEVLRVFGPLDVRVSRDGSSAVATFRDMEALRTSTLVMGLRVDLLRRKLGAGARMREQVAPGLGGVGLRGGGRRTPRVSRPSCVLELAEGSL